jgi:hypothetical protein
MEAATPQGRLIAKIQRQSTVVRAPPTTGLINVA